MPARDPDDPVDPEPDKTPGLEPGGSVPPGDTPPSEASVTEGLAHRQRAEARPAKWLWLAGIGVVVLLVALFFVALAVGQVL